MNIQNACTAALEAMPGYIIVSASELDDGWLFSFALEDGSTPDEPPLLVSKSDGSIKSYSFADHIIEIMNAKPIALSDLEF